MEIGEFTQDVLVVSFSQTSTQMVITTAIDEDVFIPCQRCLAGIGDHCSVTRPRQDILTQPDDATHSGLFAHPELLRSPLFSKHEHVSDTTPS
jgi:hypothetical protein